MAGHLLFLILLAATPATLTQEPSVADARLLRDSGRFEQALQALEARLRDQPDDVEAARLRAQTLYWLKRTDEADAAYAAALRRHPAHEGLRLDYARMLAETGRLSAAAALLEAYRAGSGSADASALLGTILYWRGDLTGAKRLFEAALRRDPAHTEAARQLAEIRTLAAPWIRIEPAIWHDDQPLDTTGVTLEGGWFITPLTTASVRSRPFRYAGGAARTFWLNEIELKTTAPVARVDAAIGGGTFRGAAGAHDWTAHVTAGFRATSGITVRGRAERVPYTYTLASLEQPVMARGLAASLHFDRRGWLGEAAVRREAWPDANATRSAYAWLLAPVAGASRGQLQVGYAIAVADSDEQRFVLAKPRQPFGPADPRFDLTGAYRPYFTPARQKTHAVLAAVTAGRHRGPVVSAGGSYGFRAHEDATVFQTDGASVTSIVERRGFSPWTGRASVEIPASRRVSIRLGGEAGRTAFYRWATAQLGLTVRFGLADR